jgi:ubiquinone/menaquinone biosynthesis C-methylase UbiE
MLKQVPWSSKQQNFAIYLIEQYLPHINVYELNHETIKEELLMDAREYTKEQVDQMIADVKKGLFSKDDSAYKYLPSSVEAFPQGEKFNELMQGIGYKNTKFIPLTFGICTLYLAEK